ncbi:hypothetical protein C8Q80DRAFT_1266976 [Daedaleopsis nitida]|nr:hypothetical protein C8Q80DRAFT_1266976 [Daedaleopsis nitida]
MAADDRSLKIAARLVCTDQWLVTHVDPSWPISFLKQYLLRRFLLASDVENNPRAIPVSPRKTRRRSLSPITFAAPTPRKAFVAAPPSSNESSHTDSSEDIDLDDDVNITKSFAEAHRYKYNARPSTSSASESVTRLMGEGGPDPQSYVILTFSTTQILEDRFSLSWYGVHQNELLELHPASLAFVTLERCSLDAYIAPYFATRVWALRIVGNRLESAPSFMRPRPGEDENAADQKTSSTREKGKRKVSVEWKERWAIIHQGVFSLCKERHDTHAAFSAPLSSLMSIRDSAHFTLPAHARRLRHKSSSASSNVVCVKFSASPGPRQRTFSNESLSVTFDRRSPHAPSAYSSFSSSQGAWWKRGSRDVSSALSLGLTSSASVIVGSGSGAGLVDVWDTFARRGSRTGLDDANGEGPQREKWKGKEREEGADAVWIVLDMLDSSACSHILRILHRHAPSSCQSTFLPSRASMYSPVPSPIIFSSRASTPFTPSSPPTPGPSSTFTFPPQPASPTTITPSEFHSAAPSIGSSDSYSFPKSPPSRIAAMLPKINTCVSAQPMGLPYPSWRLSLVRNARRAGLGAVGRAMELVMFGDEEDDDLADVEDADEEDDLAIKWARRTSSFGISPVEMPTSAVSMQASAVSMQSPRSQTLLKPPARHSSDPSLSSFKSSPTDGAVPEIEAKPEPESPSDAGPDTNSLRTPEPRRTQRQSHPLVDLSSLYDADPDPYHDSDQSEVEWVGWVDAVIEQRKQESLLARARARREALASSAALETVAHVPVAAAESGSGSGGELWDEGWSTQFGGERVRTSSPAASTPDREGPELEDPSHWRWQRGSDVDAETGTEGSDAHSSDPNASSLVSQRRATTTHARNFKAGHAQQGSTQTLSSYSSVDSLLRRTVAIRTNIKTMKDRSLSQAKRASMHVLFPAGSRSDVHLERDADLPPRAASASPPPVSPATASALSRPSLASIRSAAWARPLSPLSSQVREQQDGYDEDDGTGEGDADAEADADDGVDDVDDVDEDIDLHTDGDEYAASELGHNSRLSGGFHPVPLPGMRMVPAGYTTFQHSSLYGPRGANGAGSGSGAAAASGQGVARREEEREAEHAGIAHGQSMQRLPMGMSRMITTVSSTVSVGPGARRTGTR